MYEGELSNGRTFVCTKANYPTKEEALTFFNEGCELADSDIIDEPLTTEDIEESYMRFYPKAPYGLDYEFPYGCYCLCEKGQGAYPVWILEL